MNYTPKYISFNETTPDIDSIHIVVFHHLVGQLAEETIPVTDSRVTVTGFNYKVRLTGDVSPENPSIPLGIDLHDDVSCIKGDDESPAVSSDVYQFSYAVNPVTTINFSDV